MNRTCMVVLAIAVLTAALAAAAWAQPQLDLRGDRDGARYGDRPDRPGGPITSPSAGPRDDDRNARDRRDRDYQRDRDRDRYGDRDRGRYDRDSGGRWYWVPDQQYYPYGWNYPNYDYYRWPGQTRYYWYSGPQWGPRVWQPRRYNLMDPYW